MQNVSQKEAAEAMPLAKVETARFWRDSRFRDMECLSASFLTHEYAPHAHDTFSIGAIESGSQIATLGGRREETGPGDLYLINPGETHDGAPTEGGYRYRMIYPDMALFREVLEDVTGKSFQGTPAFGKAVLSFRGKWAYLQAKLPWAEGDEHLRSLQAKFEQHVFTPDELRQTIESSVAQFVADLDAIENQLLVDVRTDLSEGELAAAIALPAHDEALFRQEYQRLVDEVVDYIAALIRGTRDVADLESGASPRAGAMLAGAARARAAMDGRDFVIPDDVKALAPALLRHRLILSPAAEIDGRLVEDAVRTIIETIEAPR